MSGAIKGVLEASQEIERELQEISEVHHERLGVSGGSSEPQKRFNGSGDFRGFQEVLWGI